MGMIKGYFIDSNGAVQTYMAKERPAKLPSEEDKEWTFEAAHHPRRNRKAEKARRKNRMIRGSVFVAAFMAMIFGMTLAGEDPNWTVGLVGSGINLGWMALVIGANGGEL